MAHPGSDLWRHDHWGQPCHVHLIETSIGDVTIRVERRAEIAYWALDAVIDHYRYDARPAWPDGDTGCYSCRHIGNDPNRPWSAHAWGIAIDINWRDNPDGARLVHNFPDGFIDAVHRLATADGVPVWRWGGDWDRDPRTAHSYYDAMHFEVIATPDQLARGIDVSTLPDSKETTVIPILVRKQGTEKVWQVVGRTRSHVTAWVWSNFRAPDGTPYDTAKKESWIIDLAADHEVWNYPVVEDQSGEQGPPGPQGPRGEKGDPGPKPTELHVTAWG